MDRTLSEREGRVPLGLQIRAAQANSRVQVYGQELNSDTWRLAVSRLLVRDIEPRIARGDSLVDDAYEQLRADLVLCDPPAGMRMRDARMSPGDPRWLLLGSFETPPSRAADFAWLAHVIQHVREGGRGYVLLPPGSLSRGGAEARMRVELLRQGTVEAVIALPAGVGSNTLASSTIWIVREPTPNPEAVLLIDAQDEKGTITPRLRARIASALRTWRSARDTFEPSAGFATTVPVLELLGGDESLLPSRWVYEPELIDTDATFSALEGAQQELRAAHALVPARTPRFTVRPADHPPERFRVRDLIDHGLATLIRPACLKPENYADDGLPVWLPADIRPSWQREEPPRFANPATVEPRSVTQPGDIVFTTIGGLRKRVDVEGGRVLGTSLHALRLDAEMFDPHAVAALLPTEQNRRLMGGTIPRVNVLELEIPRLGRDEARRLSDLLAALDREEEAGQKIVTGAAAVRHAIIEAVATGVATVGGTSERDD